MPHNEIHSYSKSSYFPIYNHTSLQFCVHSDKQELIRMLTGELCDGMDQASVLLQLSEIIADGMYAGHIHMHGLL